MAFYYGHIMSFFLNPLNKLLNGIVPLTVMKLFQYSAKRAAESTWNVSEGSWLLHRRGPGYGRKNSPRFTSLLSLCHCFEGRTNERFSAGSYSSRNTGILWWISCWNRNVLHLVRHCRISRTFAETGRRHRTSGRSVSLWRAAGGRQNSPHLRGVTVGTPSICSTFLMNTHAQFSYCIAHTVIGH